MRITLSPRALMRRAMELAEGGRGRTSPNPLVGAVIVKEDHIVGEGFHPVIGGPHAEIVALKNAGTSAYGCTLITTLEPCCTYGKTPPCVDAIVEAGIAKVIIGSVDPNPKVNGASVKMLLDRGIEVDVGVLADEIARQNESYFKFITTRLPFVTLKAAMSLDGRLSLRRGRPTALTGPDVRQEMHLMRSYYDAILVGVETILSDDPRLSARLEGEVARQPVRVILDSKARTPIHAAVVKTSGDTLTIVATTQHAPVENLNALSRAGVIPLVLPDVDGRVDLHALMEELGNRSITNIIVEGGPKVHTSFVRQGIPDKFVVLLAPLLLGGDDAPFMIEGDSPVTISEREMLAFQSAELIGRDLVVEAYPAVFDPYDTPWAKATRQAIIVAGGTPPEENTLETPLPGRTTRY